VASLTVPRIVPLSVCPETGETCSNRAAKPDKTVAENLFRDIASLPFTAIVLITISGIPVSVNDASF
jgi:hypothetical protein